MRVPFTYRHLSQPKLAGPFSPLSTQPQTVFKYVVESAEGNSQNIDVEVHARCLRPRITRLTLFLQLYLPHSQICSVRDPIPFVVTLFAREEILSKYASFHGTSSQPSEPADHTLPGTGGSRLPQLPSIDPDLPPVQMHLFRRTQVDVHVAGLTSAYPHPERESAIWQDKSIATGVIHNVSREYSYAVWSGTINVPEEERCEGFRAKGIVVTVRGEPLFRRP